MTGEKRTQRSRPSLVFSESRPSNLSWRIRASRLGVHSDREEPRKPNELKPLAELSIPKLGSREMRPAPSSAAPRSIFCTQPTRSTAFAEAEIVKQLVAAYLET